MMVVRARRCRSRARMRQAPNFRRRSRRHHQRRHGVEAGKQRRAATMMTIKDDMPTVTLDDIHRRHDGARAAQHGRQCRALRGFDRRAPRRRVARRARPECAARSCGARSLVAAHVLDCAEKRGWRAPWQRSSAAGGSEAHCRGVRRQDDHAEGRVRHRAGRLLQITRVEAFREPAVNRSKQFARLLHLALVVPVASKIKGGDAISLAQRQGAKLFELRCASPTSGCPTIRDASSDKIAGLRHARTAIASGTDDATALAVAAFAMSILSKEYGTKSA